MTWCWRVRSCYSGIKRPINVSLNHWLSKLASTFDRAFISVNSLQLCTQRFWSSKANLSKMLAFHCWIWCAVSNQQTYKQHRISDLQSLLSSSSLLSSERVLCHCIAGNFLHSFSWRFWWINANRLKIVLTLTKSLQDVFVWPNENWRPGASDHQKKNRVLLDPVLTAGKRINWLKKIYSKAKKKKRKSIVVTVPETTQQVWNIKNVV